MALLILYILIALLAGAVSVCLLSWIIFDFQSSVSRAMLITVLISSGTFVAFAVIAILLKQPIFFLSLYSFITLALAFIVNAIIVDLIQSSELEPTRAASKFFMFFLYALFFASLAATGYLSNIFDRLTQ